MRYYCLVRAAESPADAASALEEIVNDYLADYDRVYLAGGPSIAMFAPAQGEEWYVMVQGLLLKGRHDDGQEEVEGDSAAA